MTDKRWAWVRFAVVSVLALALATIPAALALGLAWRVWASGA